MVQLSFKPHPEQRELLAACTRTPQPVERPRAVDASPLPPLPLGAPARAVGVLRELRAGDRMLGMRRPAPPTMPGLGSIEYLTRVSTAIHADYERHLDTLAVIGAIAALDLHPHTLTMALAPIQAQLAEVA